MKKINKSVSKKHKWSTEKQDGKCVSLCLKLDLN